MDSFNDRLQWLFMGGTKHVAIDATLPIFILPTILLFASLSLKCSMLSLCAIIVIQCYMCNIFASRRPKSKFFLVWTITSIVMLYSIFEYIVIPFLFILFEENIVLSVLICGFLMCFYLMKTRTNQLHRYLHNEIENGVVCDRMQNCKICMVSVPYRDHHCFWLDCCVGGHNQCFYILALFFAITALLYSANLTLTSVCHPFVFYKTILLPDDCSEVYLQFELALSFVTAVYSVGIAFILLLLCAQQFFLISIGITTNEWRKLPLISKLSFGCILLKPHNRGFIQNWSRIISTIKHY